MDNRYFKSFIGILILAVLIGGVYIMKTSNDKEQVNNNNDVVYEGLPLFVEVSSSSCGPCIQLKPILEELKEEYKGIIEMRLLDGNADWEEASQYDVTVVPTMFLFNTEGELLLKLEGFREKDVLVGIFNEYFELE